MKLLYEKIMYGYMMGVRFFNYMVKYGTLNPISYIVFEDIKLIYIPISKCGNTAMKECLLNLLEEKNEITFEYMVHSKVIKFPYEKSRTIKKKYLNGDYIIFTIIRNPLDRLISAYYSKYHLDLEKKKNNVFSLEDGKKLDFDDYLFGYLRKDPGNVTNFINKIIKIPKFLMDVHFRPMYRSINMKHPEKYIKILDLDNLAEDFEEIRRKYNLPTLNIRNKTNESKKDIVKEIPDKLIKKIKKIYKRDFDLYQKMKDNANIKKK